MNIIIVTIITVLLLDDNSRSPPMIELGVVGYAGSTEIDNLKETVR